MIETLWKKENVSGIVKNRKRKRKEPDEKAKKNE
jgi:hypothetical protein